MTGFVGHFLLKNLPVRYYKNRVLTHISILGRKIRPIFARFQRIVC